jgi:hypothetical protein
MIRSLRSGNCADALEFLRNFGALSTEPPDLRSVEVSQMRYTGPGKFLFDLDQFFRRRKRFVGITGLWEALPDRERLRAAWQSIAVELEDIDQAGEPLIRDWAADYLLAEALEPAMAPAGFQRGDTPIFDSWLAGAPDEALRRLAIRVIERELDTTVGNAAHWRAVSITEPTFRLEVQPHSLWSMIWHCFAWDTDNGILWRICPHCGKVFSPPRRDRLFCTTKLQQLHSKREWWNRNRRGLAGRRIAKE